MGRQTTLCVPLEVRPESASCLSKQIEELRLLEDVGVPGNPTNFAKVAREIPSLHFLSLSVFPSGSYDPIFVLEANIDGPPGVFWGQMEAAFGNSFREMLRCCKRPLDDDSELYDVVTAPGSRVPVSPYFEARTERPSVFHHGNRGLSRDRILAEAKLFHTVRAALDADTDADGRLYRALSPTDLHATVRSGVIDAHPWLDAPTPPRITLGERLTDGLRLLAFAVSLILVLSLPGVALAMLLPWQAYLALLLVAAAPVWCLLWIRLGPDPGTKKPEAMRLPKLGIAQLALVALYLGAATGLLALVVILVSLVLTALGVGGPLGFGAAIALVAPAAGWGLLSLVLVTGPLLVLWLRLIERRDSAYDAPAIDERMLREMVRREDWVAQNHMGSIVLIRPGVLRTLVVRLGHLGLGLLLRATATDGYLGTMRTVHFAHWAFLNNKSRLLFFSNFDHSWDSYLDDFIEKAHVGLTLAWGCGVGFPATRFLLYDGASHGRQFKNWALGSRADNQFWYSAYPRLTVDQIERNNRIATGLSQRRLSRERATAWMEDL